MKHCVWLQKAMIYCADGFFGGGRFKAIQKIGFRKLWYAVLMGFLEGLEGGRFKAIQKTGIRNLWYAVLMGFLEGGGLKLYQKLALERYDMLCWWGFLEGDGLTLGGGRFKAI